MPLRQEKRNRLARFGELAERGHLARTDAAETAALPRSGKVIWRAASELLVEKCGRAAGHGSANASSRKKCPP